ncbi:unnamed protein product [Lathyrus sativus]|nr:unnamed protein product [Lathyrus sativus]
MRYLLEFVSCCATPTILERETSVPEDEGRWLVPAPVVSPTVSASSSSSSQRRYRKKHKKSGSADWRPSLGPISEDVVVQPKGTVASAGKEVKKKTAARGAGKVYHRNYSDGYHGSMIMPAFSATPFMF